MPEKQIVTGKKWGKIRFSDLAPALGCLTVQIATKFIADLKRLADLSKKIKEYDSLL